MPPHTFFIIEANEGDYTLEGTVSRNVDQSTIVPTYLDAGLTLMKPAEGDSWERIHRALNQLREQLGRDLAVTLDPCRPIIPADIVGSDRQVLVLHPSTNGFQGRLLTAA